MSMGGQLLSLTLFLINIFAKSKQITSTHYVHYIDSTYIGAIINVKETISSQLKNDTISNFRKVDIHSFLLRLKRFCCLLERSIFHKLRLLMKHPLYSQ